MHTATSTHPIASFPSLAKISSGKESMATPHSCQGHGVQEEAAQEHIGQERMAQDKAQDNIVNIVQGGIVQENMAQGKRELAQLVACSHTITPSSSLLTASVLGRTWPVIVLLFSMWFLSFLVLGWI